MPEGEVYVAVESPRGEIRLLRVLGRRPRGRGASASALRASSRSEATATCMGHALVADMIAVVGSLDTVMGEVDR